MPVIGLLVTLLGTLALGQGSGIIFYDSGKVSRQVLKTWSVFILFPISKSKYILVKPGCQVQCKAMQYMNLALAGRCPRESGKMSIKPTFCCAQSLHLFLESIESCGQDHRIEGRWTWELWTVTSRIYCGCRLSKQIVPLLLIISWQTLL